MIRVSSLATAGIVAMLAVSGATMTTGALAAGSVTIAINTLGAETWWPQDIAGNKYITSTIGDPLVRLVAPFSLEPAIARSWTVSPDGLSYEFVLRDDVVFHDGSKLSGTDVAFSMSPDNVQKFVGFSLIKGGNLELVTADGNRVTMKVKKAVPMMIDNYVVRISIWPKAYIERVSADGFNAKPIGAGPFKFDQHVKGQFVKMSAFDRYYGGKPKVDEVTWRVVPEAATRIAMLRAGEADATFNEIGPNTGELIKYGFKVRPYGQPLQNVLIFNNQIQKEPMKSRFDDIRVRQALVHAIDRKSIADAIYYGTAKPATVPVVGSSLPAFDAKFAPLAFDVARARRLLSEAGLTSGFEVDLHASTATRELATLLSSFWQAVGVRASIKLLDPAALSTAWFQRKVEGDGIILGAGLANGIASLVYLDPTAQVAMVADPDMQKLHAEGMAIIDTTKQDAWMKTVLSPALDRAFPVPTLLEYAEGVIGLGPKVKSWEKFDNHALGIQWLELVN